MEASNKRSAESSTPTSGKEFSGETENGERQWLTNVGRTLGHAARSVLDGIDSLYHSMENELTVVRRPKQQRRPSLEEIERSVEDALQRLGELFAAQDGDNYAALAKNDESSRLVADLHHLFLRRQNAVRFHEVRIRHQQDAPHHPDPASAPPAIDPTSGITVSATTAEPELTEPAKREVDEEGNEEESRAVSAASLDETAAPVKGKNVQSTKESKRGKAEKEEE